jgi:hypothetical protein
VFLCVATVEKSCFQESGAIGSEIFTVFTSIPVVSHAVVRAVEALINPATGRKYGESATGTTETPDVPQLGVHESAAAATCAACFQCKVCAAQQFVQSLLYQRTLNEPVPLLHCRRFQK